MQIKYLGDGNNLVNCLFGVWYSVTPFLVLVLLLIVTHTEPEEPALQTIYALEQFFTDKVQFHMVWSQIARHAKGKRQIK